MLELLKFEYTRLLKCKPVWLLVAYAILLPVLAAIGLQVILINLGDDSFDIDTTQVKFFTWYVIAFFYERLPLVLALFIPLFIGRDYKDGVIRNKLIAGHSRVQIFMSAVIPQVTLAVVLSIIYVLSGIIAIALTDFGCNINHGEMLARAFTLLLSLVATTVFFSVISLLIKSRAGTVVICIAFVFSFSFFSMMATNFAYTHKMVDQYEEYYNEKVGQINNASPTTDIYFSGFEEFDKDTYFNAGWYVGHPIFLLTDAGLSGEFIPSLNSMISSSDDIFAYPKEISRLGILNSYLNFFTGNYGAFVIGQEIFDNIDGAYVKFEQAEIEYNIKSIVWTAVYLGAGYVLFRKKNIF